MDDESLPVRKRRRPALSCIQCRRRKVKCDRNSPCNHCTISHYECAYDRKYTRIDEFIPNSQNSSRVSPATDQSAPAQWKPIPGHQDGFRAHVPTPGPSPKPPASRDSLLNCPPPSSEKTVEQLTKHVKSLEQKVADLTAASIAPSAFPRVRATEARGIFSKSRFFGPAHWMSSLEQFDKLRAFTHNAEWNDTSSFKQAPPNADLHAFISKCKALSKIEKEQQRIKIIPEAELNGAVPQRATAEKLIDLYLQNFETAFRILHIPTFKNECAQYWEQQEAKPATGFLLKLLLVLAIGASIYENPKDEVQLRNMAQDWLHTAQAWLYGPFDKSRLNLTGIQVHCLFLLARQTIGIGSDLVWISAGSLVRMAMQTGLHLDPNHFPKISILHAEIRRRLWATILELSLQSSLDSGMQPLISISDFDTQPPLNIDDTDISETTQILPTEKPLTTFTQTSSQIILLNTLATRLEAARISNDFHAEPQYDTVLQLSTQLSKACREMSVLAQNYQAQSSGQITPFKPFHRNILDLFHYRFLLILHRSFANKARTDPKYYFSRKICLDAATVIMSPQRDYEFHKLQLVGGGPFREIVRHGTISLTLELLNQIEEDSQGLSVQQNKQNREPLFRLLRDMILLLAERIKIHENNVKGHLFMSMSLAQIEATEAGIPPESVFADAARASLTTCYELMKARIKGGESPEESSQRPQNEAVQNGNAPNTEYNFTDEYDLSNFVLPDSWLFQGWNENTWV
ncbi:fungal-specific transcription factor domain-containing protein [Xylogone sp. PMI_703]|nr:fungal-specific transcription factor domain-containing protein [Xylogone sp. PMI_703]